ncbi:MAG: tRNA-intron lyase [Candidatus Thermoplasmatota archaeon]|jgi:tRNA-intron endonuclease|nr:tRNA-intron lyase [Candidatus Thermoplasmatota archaeon]
MQIHGKIVNDKIIVDKPKDVGRLYNKSHFGTPLPGNKLELDLIEGVFLSEEGKIKIFRNKCEISFDELVKIAIKNIFDFEIKYLVYKDLRKRGHIIKLFKEDKKIIFYELKNNFLIKTFSERDIFDIDETKKLLKNAKKKDKQLWFAIVDEEGDLTYYKINLLEIKGVNKEYTYDKVNGVLLKNRVIIFDTVVSKNLYEKEFYGKPFGKDLQLSLVEALYLLEKGIIDIKTEKDKKLSKEELEQIIFKLQPDIVSRLVVFKDLKKKGLIVKTGFKFGAHFRVYTSKPDDTHAEYLIHVVDKGFKSTWAEISRAVRLAHSVNKQIVFARVNKDKIDYIDFGRLRP